MSQRARNLTGACRSRCRGAERPEELLVARDGPRRRPVLLGVLRHDRAGLERSVGAQPAFHHGPPPLAEEVRRDAAVVDGDGCLAVAQEEPLLVRGEVLLEGALDHHAAQAVGASGRAALGHELGRGDEVDHRLPDARQDERAQGQHDDSGAEEEAAPPGHGRPAAGRLCASRSSIRIPDSTRHQYVTRTPKTSTYAPSTKVQWFMRRDVPRRGGPYRGVPAWAFPGLGGGGRAGHPIRSPFWSHVYREGEVTVVAIRMSHLEARMSRGSSQVVYPRPPSARPRTIQSWARTQAGPRAHR